MKAATIGQGQASRDDADQAFGQRDRLVAALEQAREEITALREEVDKLSAPPASYGVYLSSNDDGTVNLLASGRKSTRRSRSRRSSPGRS